MVRIIKAYDSRFKSSIAISALSEAKSLLEIGSEHNVPKSNIIEWRDKLIACSPELFVPLHEKNKQIRLLKQEIYLGSDVDMDIVRRSDPQNADRLYVNSKNVIKHINK